MQIYVALQKRGWSRRTHDMHWFLRRAFLMIHMSYGVFLHKDMPFRGAVVASQNLGEQIPPKNKIWGA